LNSIRRNDIIKTQKFIQVKPAPTAETKTNKKGRKMDEKPKYGSEEENSQEFMPPLDFSSIVFPLYTQALIKLGLMEDPRVNRIETDLEYAKRLIDILDILKDRTKGNLEPEEENLLEAILSQLKLHYLKKIEAIKL